MKRGIRSSKSFTKNGSYNVICDYTGFKFKAEDTLMTWDGYRVGRTEWEARHPLDFTPKPRPTKSVPNARPEFASPESDINTWAFFEAKSILWQELNEYTWEDLE